MAPSEEIRQFVLQFYRNFYGEDGGEGFLCRGNDVFMHPVLTPNFFRRGTPDAGQLAADRRRFRDDFGQSRHWLQLFPDQIDDRELNSAGYRQCMDCAFNVFTSPLPVRKIPGIDSIIYKRIPENLRAEYEQKTEANSHNLPPAILRRIEHVLRAGSDRVAVCTARLSEGRLAGAVTLVRAGRITLFVNAWVDQPLRGRGLMSFLYGEALRRELTAGQDAAFYWTFNPIVGAKGNLVGRVRVFEFQPDRPQ